MGYKRLGAAVVDEKGNLDRNEFYNVCISTAPVYGQDVRAEPAQIPKDDFLGISKSPFAHPQLLYDNSSLIKSYILHAHALVHLVLSHLNTHLHLPPNTLSSLHRQTAISGDHIRIVKSPPQPPLDLRTPSESTPISAPSQSSSTGSAA